MSGYSAEICNAFYNHFAASGSLFAKITTNPDDHAESFCSASSTTIGSPTTRCLTLSIFNGDVCNIDERKLTGADKLDSYATSISDHINV